MTDGFAGTLLPHQAAAVDWLWERPRALLADDVGLGKTITALALIAKMREEGELSKARPFHVLWLTDASLVASTREKVRQFTPDLANMTPEHKLGAMDAPTRRIREQDLPDGIHVYLVSYQQLNRWRDKHDLRTLFPEPALVVMDEAMTIKGGGAIHDAVREVTLRAVRVLAMTATPYENDPTETYSVLQAVQASGLWSPREFDARFVEWRPSYRMPTGAVVPAKPVGVSPGRVGELRDYLATVMLRRTADDAGLTLPRRVGERYRWVQLSGQQRQAYNRASARNPGLSRHHALERAGKISGVSSSLIDALMGELAGRHPAEKVIVGCETLDVVDQVAERLTQARIGNRRIEGKTKKPDRDSAISDFRNEPEVRVLVGSRVLERGLDLQFARVLISLDSSYNPQREHQREGRVCRIGSPHDTYEHLTLLPDTPKARQKTQVVSDKQAESRLLLDRTPA